ncbi:hypothetical protein CRENBAI_023087 [Crenichthys baileyi]|uniref:Uncharacterized protein n=1 Tax=Crenichthys baileyi TaxID=28760 RepID=A0AAV9RI56_9TELE
MEGLGDGRSSAHQATEVSRRHSPAARPRGSLRASGPASRVATEGLWTPLLLLTWLTDVLCDASLLLTSHCGSLLRPSSLLTVTEGPTTAFSTCSLPLGLGDCLSSCVTPLGSWRRLSSCSRATEGPPTLSSWLTCALELLLMPLRSRRLASSSCSLSRGPADASALAHTASEGLPRLCFCSEVRQALLLAV